MSRAIIKTSSNDTKKSKEVTTRETPKGYHKYPSRYEKSYFYKADYFPEVVVNERRERKSLANSCHIELPE